MHKSASAGPMMWRKMVLRSNPYVSSPSKDSPTISSKGNSYNLSKVKTVWVLVRKNCKKIRDVGKRITETMKGIASENLVVVDGFFSLAYALNATVNRRREKAIIPVK